MPLLVGKAHYFVLDRGAVSGPYTLDNARIEGGTVNIIENYLLGLVVCVAYVTDHRIFGELFGFIGEGNYTLISRLNLKLGKVYRAFKDTGRGSGFKATKGNIKSFKGIRQTLCGKKAVRASRIGRFADENLTRKEGSRCENYRLADVFGRKSGNEMPTVLGGVHIDNLGLL